MGPSIGGRKKVTDAGMVGALRSAAQQALAEIWTSSKSLAYRARRRAATVALIACTAPLAYHAVFGHNGALAYHREKVESQRLADEIKDLQQQNAAKQQNIQALRTDPKAIEREAREQLHYARPNDVVITLPQQKPDQPQTAVAQKR